MRRAKSSGKPNSLNTTQKLQNRQNVRLLPGPSARRPGMPVTPLERLANNVALIRLAFCYGDDGRAPCGPFSSWVLAHSQRAHQYRPLAAPPPRYRGKLAALNILDSIASDECPVCRPPFSDQPPACAALVAKPARRLWQEVSVGPAPRRLESSRFRERLAKRKDQFLEFGFGYLFRSSHPGKPLRHTLVHFWPVFELASDPHWKNVNAA